jgi:hypothetical protein
MPNQVPRCAKIVAGSTRKPSRKFTVFDVRQHVKRQKVRILTAAQAARRTQRIKEDAHVEGKLIQ